MSTRIARGALASAAIAAGALLLAGTAGATTSTDASGATGSTGATGPSSFSIAQQQLEQQLAGRSTQLQHLLADVTGATSLTPQHANLLEARLSTEQTSITGLINKVPHDTTFAELKSDRSAMLRDNRVYAVMTPQVFVTISADVVLSQAASLQREEPSLLADVNSIVGDHGYTNALNHYDNLVKRLTGIATGVGDVETTVLAQTPQSYPGDTQVFVHANHVVLNADVSLAYANYDATVIALATGGYTGS